MANIPGGTSYPKMVTMSDGARTVPLVYPAGDAKQFTYVLFNNAADEAAYGGNGVLITTTHGQTQESWANGPRGTGTSGKGK